jgi:hypothetical protein
VIDLLLAVGLLLLGVGIGIMVMFWYVKRRIERVLAGDLAFFKLLTEVSDESE